MADTLNLVSAEDCEIEQGTTWRLPVLWNQPGTALPVDLTGYTARMQIRRTLNSADYLIELTDTNGRIVFNADRTLGLFDLLLSATDTAGLTAPAGVYDLEMVDSNGEVTRLLEGAVEISKEVTR